MKIVVIGLGSMGKRRIRLLKKYNPGFFIVGVDNNLLRQKEITSIFGIPTFSGINDIQNGQEFSCVFVCTPPLTHQEIIRKCLYRGYHIFTELNLVDDGYDENISYAIKNGLTLFLSSTLLYRKELIYINKKISELDSTKIVNYSYHVGQYLPDWHPWENYTDFFVSHKRTNGCREIMAIELPWLIKVFGEIENVVVERNSLSSLKLPYPDSYFIMLKHSSGSQGVLIVDVVTRKAVRNLEIFGECLYITWDGTPFGFYEYDYNTKKKNNIKFYENVDKIDGYENFIIEDAYYQEIIDFFSVLDNKIEARYGFADDKKVLELIDQIEGFDAL